MLGGADGPALEVGESLGDELPDGLEDGIKSECLVGEADGPALEVGESLGEELPDGLDVGVSGRGCLASTEPEKAASTNAMLTAPINFMG